MTYCSVRRNLEQLVRTDPITELLDRRGVGETFERQAERSSFDGAALSCILIDIDDFKEINDRWGHSVGDRVICSVADVIRASVRPSDAAGRIGGDEFLAVLPGATPSEAQLVAERIRNGVRDMRLSENGALVDATVSIGVSSVPTDVTSVTDVLTLTEDLLRSSKRSGKDTVSVRRKAG
jgi:diguanylate cyclase (GGDEF)-like protein